MSYDPTIWQTGDLIVQGKLNHLEDGITAANRIFGFTDVYLSTSDQYQLTATWQEIRDAINNHSYVYYYNDDTDTESWGLISSISAFTYNNNYILSINTYGDYVAQSPNEYPVQSLGG